MTETIRFRRNIRRAGGSVEITVPPELERAAGLKPGDTVDLYLHEGKIVIERVSRKEKS